MEENPKPVKKDGRGGVRFNSGRKTQRETAGLIAKLKPYEDEMVAVLVDLALKGDLAAIKLYFAYYAGNPTTTTNSNIKSQITTIDLKNIISFKGDEIEFENVDDNDEIDN